MREHALQNAIDNMCDQLEGLPECPAKDLALERFAEMLLWTTIASDPDGAATMVTKALES